MKQRSDQLIDDLKVQCEEMRKDAVDLLQISDPLLHQRPHEKSWNVLECVEHMNLYGDYYLKEIEERIQQSEFPSEELFKSGWFGNYAAESMLPKKSGATNWPMKTFPKMDPFGFKGEKKVIERFVEQMEQLQKLIERSRHVSLRKTKCTLTIKWLKFNLGDTLRFMVYHNYRHMLQVKRIMSELKKGFE